MYWIIEATPQGGMTETDFFWGEHESEVIAAVSHAKSFARSILRPIGTLVHWAVYGPFKVDRDNLFENGVI